MFVNNDGYSSQCVKSFIDEESLPKGSKTLNENIKKIAKKPQKDPHFIRIRTNPPNKEQNPDGGSICVANEKDKVKLVVKLNDDEDSLHPLQKYTNTAMPAVDISKQKFFPRLNNTVMKQRMIFEFGYNKKNGSED